RFRTTGTQFLSRGGFSSGCAEISDKGAVASALLFVVIRSEVEQSLNSVLRSLGMRETNIRSQTAAVIPAYQDEIHIGDIARRTRERLDHVLVVDDGSTDQTEERAREAGAGVIVHSQNQGKGEAIKTGLAHWLGNANSSNDEQDRQIMWVVLLDSDGQ